MEKEERGGEGGKERERRKEERENRLKVTHGEGGVYDLIGHLFQ